MSFMEWCRKKWICLIYSFPFVVWFDAANVDALYDVASTNFNSSIVIYQLFFTLVIMKDPLVGIFILCLLQHSFASRIIRTLSLGRPVHVYSHHQTP